MAEFALIHTEWDTEDNDEKGIKILSLVHIGQRAIEECPTLAMKKELRACYNEALEILEEFSLDDLRAKALGIGERGSLLDCLPGVPRWKKLACAYAALEMLERTGKDFEEMN